jgi:hypothetical protein
MNTEQRRNFIGAVVMGISVSVMSIIFLYPCPDEQATKAKIQEHRKVQLTGRVLDSKTKRPVHNACVVLEISGDTTYVTDSSGIFTVSENETELSTEFTVIVHAAGYKVRQFRVRSGIEASKFGTILLERD